MPSDAFSRFVAENDVEFVFVDDGSRDNTAERIEDLRRGVGDRVHLIRAVQNQGKAEAVRTGMNYALNRNADFIGFLDADLATPLDVISRFMAVFDERPEIDIVIGARIRLLGHRIRRRAVRHWLGRTFARTASVMLHLPIYDTQCGAKIFRNGPHMRQLLSQPFNSRWIFDVEIFARYIRWAGAPEAAAERIYEYPLPAWQDVGGSKVRPATFLIALRDMARIYWENQRFSKEYTATRLEKNDINEARKYS